MHGRHGHPGHCSRIKLFSNVLFYTSYNRIVCRRQCRGGGHGRSYCVYNDCGGHAHSYATRFVHASLLATNILSGLQRIARCTTGRRDHFIGLLVRRGRVNNGEGATTTAGRLRRTRRHVTRIDHVVGQLCRSGIGNGVDSRHFVRLSTSCRRRRQRLGSHTTTLRTRLSGSRTTAIGTRGFVNVIQGRLTFRRLAPALLQRVVRGVIIRRYDCSRGNAHERSVRVCCDFINGVSLPRTWHPACPAR